MIAYETRSQELFKCKYWVRSTNLMGIACVVVDKCIQMRAAADQPPMRSLRPEFIAIVWQGPKVKHPCHIGLPWVIDYDEL